MYQLYYNLQSTSNDSQSGNLVVLNTTANPIKSHQRLEKLQH